MKAQDVQGLFEAILPYSFIEEAVKRLGVQKRQRLFRPEALVISLALVGGTAEAGRIATTIRDYFDRGNPAVARSVYYGWFGAELLALMQELVERAKTHVREMPRHLPGILAGRSDWRAFDSTTVRLHDDLKVLYPGTGDYAALKVHVELSLGCENVVDYHISPAREHDGPHLTVDEKRRGTGLIVDMGYVSHDLFRSCAKHDVHLVVRLKEGWKVFLDGSATEGEQSEWVGGAELLRSLDWDAPLDIRDHAELDVDVRMGPTNAPVHARLVTVETPEGWRAFLTNLPRSTHTREEVAMLYRLRWNIELQNKLAKTGCQLDEVTAKTAVPMEILVHASMLASMLANAAAHLEHLDQGLVGANVPKLKRPPVHAMVIWKCIVSGSVRITDLLCGVAHPDGWEHVANRLTRGGQDPNWRRRPSPMDMVKGRTANGRPWRDPARRRRAA